MAKITIESLFKKHLKQAIKDGYDHRAINCLAGCERKLVLTEAEGEAGKRTYKQFMAKELWNEPGVDDKPGWLFGSPKTGLNIGLVPDGLAAQRKGLNSGSWDSYQPIV